ncbi:vitamin K epoxide reductase family protein [Streptomyces sp. VNUA116]|uniref:vitamin K epoxide reductase family protein n=1 Tax=Streptomyces sp. VNUA116 TaxID=3062449 RepID=UPI002675ED18|nr:vitamin K epoxide reductase family protein [Streptomyces sp. VNUA116]WKU48781.1 vitamin K epoxide reductase family protein [Streptomyces sp. VNUA116]
MMRPAVDLEETEDARQGAAERARTGEVRPLLGAGRAFAWMLIVTGALGLLASFVITVDKFRLLQEPGFQPSCSINPVISCTNVMSSPQASVFGFPNPLLGLAGYGAVTLIGFGLLAGAGYRRWFWIGLNLGTLAGAGFCMWLMAQALYSIGALCLWCCLAWFATIAMFWCTTLHNLKHGIVPAPRRPVIGLLEFPWAVPVTWYLVIVMLIGARFWTYWRSLI